MRIAIIAYLHGFGGAEKQLIMLGNQMVDRKHDVYMILVSDDKICYHIDERIKIISIVFAENCCKFRTIINRFFYLNKILRKISPDIVVNFNLQSAVMLAFLNKNKIGKLIYSERGDPDDDEYKGVLGLFRRISFPRLNGFVFQTDGAMNYFSDKRILTKSTVIPNACFLQNIKKFNGVRKKKIVTIGRFHPQKNHELLIRAFARLSNEFQDYKLEIYGDGLLKHNLIDLVHKLGLTRSVTFMGNSRTVLEEIQNASLFVLSSNFEGIPNVLIEAMAMGLPCISTDCKPGGARLLIQNGVNGLITPLGDEIALASAIKQLLVNSTEASRLGNEAMKIADIFSPNNIYDKWESFLLKVVDK